MAPMGMGKGDVMLTPEELRSLVAEKVMGYEKQGWGSFMVWSDNHSYVTTVKGWHPLESWADTGRVLNRLKELGFFVRIDMHSEGFSYVEVAKGGYQKAHEAGNDLKELISLAALRALGVEVE